MSSIQWTKHLKDKDKKESFNKRLKAQKQVFEVLKNILDNKMDTSIKEMRKADNYSLPKWECYQAHQLGRQEMLQEIIDLLPLEK